MKRRIAISAAALLVLLLLGGWLSIRWAQDEGLRRGSVAGAQTLERLQVVWPDVLQMPDDDRLVLADLAMRCRLDQEPLVAQNVVRCLRSATAGRDSAENRAILARLLPRQYATSTESR